MPHPFTQNRSCHPEPAQQERDLASAFAYDLDVSFQFLRMSVQSME